MSTLASATNARIKSTNKHVSMNAAQIKENAKKPREDLDKAVSKFDKKVANARSEAAKGRGGLSQHSARPILRGQGHDQEQREQDQRSRERVRHSRKWCSRTLANGSRQVPPREDQQRHERQGCPPGRQG